MLLLKISIMMGWARFQRTVCWESYVKLWSEEWVGKKVGLEDVHIEQHMLMCWSWKCFKDQGEGEQSETTLCEETKLEKEAEAWCFLLIQSPTDMRC